MQRGDWRRRRNNFNRKSSSHFHILAPHCCLTNVKFTFNTSLFYLDLQITIPLSSTLNALKDAINTDRTLGPLKRDQQRLFHLGREIKTGNRSLSALGIGKHNVFSIHLHSSAPKTVDLQSDEDTDTGKMSASRRRKTKASNAGGAVGAVDNNGVIDLAGSESSPLVRGRSRNNNNQTHTQQHQHQEEEEGEEKVVELLDSDSDDDDDVVEIVETAPKRRRRKN